MKKKLKEKKKRKLKKFVNLSSELELMVKSIKINNPGLPEKIEQAFRIVDRKFFVKHSPYSDEALHVAFGQTISQPTTIARMLMYLDLFPGLDVLEVGTNTGYHAALVSWLVYPGTVTTIEIFPELAENAERNINKLIKHLKSKELKERFKIQIVVGDALDENNQIWFKKYDRIYFTAGVSKENLEKVKEMGKTLLKENGLLLFPSREFFDFGNLQLWKFKNGKLQLVLREKGYAFVPLLRQKDLEEIYKVVKRKK
ncbi:MAG: hypothetical protein NZ889_01490 [Candidatus Pacearchaeota archaeon]|nr:hypothetical protein [Candidatus Pacearchaeota archaeon]